MNRVSLHLPENFSFSTEIPIRITDVNYGGHVGNDSILSILQMPNGVPVATVALNAAKNAGILATEIIGAFNEPVGKKIVDYKQQLNHEVQEKISHLQFAGWPNGFDV